MYTQKEKNLGLAIAGIVLINTRFPLGGLNRVDVFSSLPLAYYFSQLNLLYCMRASYSENPSTANAIFLSNHLKGLYCGEMAQLTMRQLVLVAEDTPIEIVSLEHHQMLVIGRSPDSDPINIDTWGEDAVICDPWSRKFYEASKFKLEQEDGEKIKFITEISMSQNSILNTEDEYLRGSPRIGF